LKIGIKLNKKTENFGRPYGATHGHSSVVCTVPTSDVGKHWAIEIVLRFSYLKALNEAEIDVSDYRL
jgi:hypothetical protein